MLVEKIYFICIIKGTRKKYMKENILLEKEYMCMFYGMKFEYFVV